MGKYVSRVDVTIDGQQISDMKNFKELARQIAEQVPLMKKTGYVNKTIRNKFSLDYVIPAGTRFDFTTIENSTVMVALEDGGTINFAGVRCLEIGDADYDGEKEVVQTITFGAESRVDQ